MKVAESFAVLCVCVGLLGAPRASAQDPQPAPTPAPPVAAPAPATPALSREPRPAQVSLEVQVLISRYQGEKRVSSIPYILAVNANAAATQLNMGADVPVATTTFSPADGKQPSPVRSFNYRNVGTSIECTAVTSATPNAFDVTLNVDESSVGSQAETSTNASIGADLPVFRNFRSRTRLTLRDGQTRQYTAATDRVSGETTRLEVTLRQVK